MVNKIQILRSNAYGNRPAALAQPYGTPYVNFADKQFGVVDSAQNPQDLIGVPFFSTTSNYNAGQPVNYQGKLYTALGSVVAGVWNPAQWAVIGASGTVLRGFLSGLILSTAGASATFSVSPGQATNSTNVDYMSLNAAISKTTAAWVAGNAAGGLDTGAIAINTWYHVHLIRNPSSSLVDVLVSLSPSAPTLPTGYTEFRRLGSMKTNASSQWTQFTQWNDNFFWTAVVAETVAQPPASTDVTITLSGIPTGIRVYPYIRVSSGSSAAGNVVAYNARSPDMEPSVAALISGGSNPYSSSGITTNVMRIAGHDVPLISNVNAQLVFCVDIAQTSFAIRTSGWGDDRGKLS